MDTICLWVGRVVVVSFGITGTVWLVSRPLEYAWQQVKADAVFVKAFREVARRNKKGNRQ